MSKQILQVSMKLNISVEEYKHHSEHVAPVIAKFPGVVWKVWILNEAESEVGGIYLFDSPEALHAYVIGPLAQLTNNPAFREVRIKSFDTVDELSAITRAPLGLKAGVMV
jgi:hypothetical protein